MASSPAAKRKLSSSCEAPAETIDWSNNPNGTNHFDDRFADAYMGKTYPSDMSFFVELDQTSIPSHSFIVAPASKVLERCIFGTGSIANPDRVVKVRDCPLAEFHILLRYLYTGRVVEKITIENAIILMPLAHYFNLHALENICAERSKEQLTAQTVCETFDKIHFLDNPFTVKCLEVMEHNTRTLLADGSLYRMQVPSLDKILNNDVLNILCESELLTALLCWADGQCTKSNLELNSANRRTVVNDRLYYIRFAAMSGDVFTKCLSDVGKHFFTKDEIIDIVHCIAMGRDDCKDTLTKAQFSSKPRRIIRRLEALRGKMDSRSIRSSREVIKQKASLKVYNYVFGFDSNEHITSIVDSNQQNVEFYQTGKRFIFTKLLSFVASTDYHASFECEFTIKTNGYLSNYYIDMSFEGDKNITLSNNSCITALYVA